MLCTACHQDAGNTAYARSFAHVDRVKYPQGRWSQSFGHVGHGHAVSNRESSSQLSEHEGHWRKSCTVRRLVLVRHEHYTTTMPPHQTDDRMPEHDFGRLNVSLGWLVYNNNNHNSNTLVSAIDHHSDFTEAHDIVTIAV